jgi:hypothetical protein
MSVKPTIDTKKAAPSSVKMTANPRRATATSQM